MKKVNCAAVIVAAMMGVGAVPAIASTPQTIQATVIPQIASVQPLAGMTILAQSQQQQQQQQQQQKKLQGLANGLFTVPSAGFAV